MDPPASLDNRDRFAPTTTATPPPGDSITNHHNSMDQPLLPEDDRIVTANPTRDPVIERPQSSNAGAVDLTIVPPQPSLNIYEYSSHEQTRAAYGGYGNTTGTWDGYSQHINTADALHMSPIIYNDNQSLLYHSGYGYNPEMAYGQYSPLAAPLPPMMLDGQLYSPQQIPFSPSFYPQTAPPAVPSSGPIPPSELLPSESHSDNSLFGPGYFIHYGSYGGGNMHGAPGSGPLASPSTYHQPLGILGPYEHHVAQASQQRPLHGYGLTSTSSAGPYQHGGTYQTSGYGSRSISCAGTNDRMRVGFDKGRRRERDQDSLYISNDPVGFDRNRGPRASKPRGKNTTEQLSSGNGKGDSAGSGIPLDSYNQADFVTDYKSAKFFIIKSFSEDNVHKSIKYSVWASTPHGNKKIDAAYREAKDKEGNCPVFLLFSVNASGQFCGVAEMVGPVDFEKDADYWQQDRWSGQFPVQWHIIKDVPNSRFRHILLENNDNKPVTHSRDSQEVSLEQGVEMLKIFKDYDAPTSMLDDFEFYDQCERSLKERKAKQQPSLKTDGPGLLVDDAVNQISDSFAQSLQLDGDKETAAREEGVGANLRPDVEILPANNCNTGVELGNDSALLVSNVENSINHNSSHALKLEDDSGEYQHEVC